MQNKVKQYWWNERPNFGDALAPKITEFVLGKQVEWASPSECQLFGLGSNLEKIIDQTFIESRGNVSVWGTGLIAPKSSSSANSKLKILSLRGHFSSICLDCTNLVVGDPGLLVREMYPELLLQKKEFDVGLVLHHTQHLNNNWRNKLKDNGIHFFSAGTNDYESLIESIAKSKIILSSSLHGLVIADSLGVPNEWMNSHGIHRTDRFKFHDYASAIGRAINTPFFFSDINRALRRAQTASRDYMKNIDDINKNLKSVLRSHYS
jgi:hypothetical protein